MILGQWNKKIPDRPGIVWVLFTDMRVRANKYNPCLAEITIDEDGKHDLFFYTGPFSIQHHDGGRSSWSFESDFHNDNLMFYEIKIEHPDIPESLTPKGQDDPSSMMDTKAAQKFLVKHPDKICWCVHDRGDRIYLWIASQGHKMMKPIFALSYNESDAGFIPERIVTQSQMEDFEEDEILWSDYVPDQGRQHPPTQTVSFRTALDAFEDGKRICRLGPEGYFNLKDPSETWRDISFSHEEIKAENWIILED